jgi:hypothetical protein
MEVTVSDLNQYSNSLLKSLRAHSEIKEVQSSFVLETVKASAPLPIRSIWAR